MKFKIIFFIAVVCLLQVKDSHGAEGSNPFQTSIEQIEQKLLSSSHKRLIIGGLHQKTPGMKRHWKIAEDNDIVLNNSSPAAPDIYANGFDSQLEKKLAPLSYLMQLHPELRFNEIIFEHVGSGTGLNALLKENLNPLPFLSQMLVPGGKFTHQSSYQALDVYPAKVFEMFTFRHQLKALPSLTTKLNTLSPGNPILFIDPKDYPTYFESSSVLLQYIASLQNQLAYTNIQLSIDTPAVDAPYPTFAFNVTGIKPI